MAYEGAVMGVGLTDVYVDAVCTVYVYACVLQEGHCSFE